MRRLLFCALPLTLLLLGHCAAEAPAEPTATVVVQATAAATQVVAAVTNTPVPPTPTPTATAVPDTPTPALTPTSTVCRLQPTPESAEAPPEGFIVFPEIEGRSIGSTSLNFAIPHGAADNWCVETVLEGVNVIQLYPSLDGQKLAIAQYQDTNEDGFAPTPQGGDKYKLFLYDFMSLSLVPLSDKDILLRPEIRWLPDDETLTYIDIEDVWTIKTDGSLHQPLIDRSNGLLYRHKWSPDGRWLAYLYPISPGSTSGEAALAIFDPLTEQTIAVDEAVSAGLEIEWSPDSRYLAFNDNGLSIFDIETQIVTEIVPPGVITLLSWTSDGEGIAFRRHPGKLEVWNRSTNKISELVSVEHIFEYSWLPDNSGLVFITSDNEKTTLSLVDRASGESRALLMAKRVDPPGRIQRINEIVLLGWSPDGEWLLLRIEPEQDAVGFYAYRYTDESLHLITQVNPGTYYTSQSVFWLPGIPPLKQVEN